MRRSPPKLEQTAPARNDTSSMIVGQTSLRQRGVRNWCVMLAVVMSMAATFYAWRTNRNTFHLDVHWPIEQRSHRSRLLMDGRSVPLLAGNIMRYRMMGRPARLTAQREGFLDATTTLDDRGDGHTTWRPRWSPSPRQRRRDRVRELRQSYESVVGQPAFDPRWSSVRRETQRLLWSSLSAEQRRAVEQMQMMVPSPMGPRLIDEATSAADGDAVDVGFGQRPDWTLGQSRWRHADAVTHLQFSDDGRRLLSVSHDGEIRISVVIDGEILARSFVPQGTAEAAAATPDLKLVACGGSGGSVHLWWPDQRRSFRLHPPHGRVRTLAFSPDGQRLLSGGSDLKLRLWRVDGEAFRGELANQWTLSHHVVATAWSADGSHWIGGDSNGICLLIRRSDHQTVRLLGGPPQRTLFIDSTPSFSAETRVVGLGPNFRRAVWRIPKDLTWKQPPSGIEPLSSDSIAAPLGIDLSTGSFWSVDSRDEAEPSVQLQPIDPLAEPSETRWTLSDERLGTITSDAFGRVAGPSSNGSIAMGLRDGSIVVATTDGDGLLVAPEHAAADESHQAIEAVPSSDGNRWAVLWRNGDVSIIDAFDRTIIRRMAFPGSDKAQPTADDREPPDDRLFPFALGWCNDDRVIACLFDRTLSTWRFNETQVADSAETNPRQETLTESLTPSTRIANRWLGSQPLANNIWFDANGVATAIEFDASATGTRTSESPALRLGRCVIHPSDDLVASLADDRFVQVLSSTGKVLKRIPRSALTGGAGVDDASGRTVTEWENADLFWLHHQRLVIDVGTMAWSWNPWSELQPAVEKITIPPAFRPAPNEAVDHFVGGNRHWRSRGGWVTELSDELSADPPPSVAFAGTANRWMRYSVHPGGRTVAVCDGTGLVRFYFLEPEVAD